MSDNEIKKIKSDILDIKAFQKANIAIEKMELLDVVRKKLKSERMTGHDHMIILKTIEVIIENFKILRLRRRSEKWARNLFAEKLYQNSR